VTILPVALWL